MTTGRTARAILWGTTGALWAGTVVASTADMNIKPFATICLATLISSLWSLAAWLTRPDHGMLSHVRLKVATMRLDGAMSEEGET